MVGAVGFMNQKLQVPEDLDSNWATLINDCWHRYVTEMDILCGDCIVFLLNNCVFHNLQ